jgi:HEAT repeat protein
MGEHSISIGGLLKSKTLIKISLLLALFGSGLIDESRCTADDRSKAIEKIIKQLSKEKKPEKRAEAAKTLGQMKAVEAIPALSAALQDPDAGVRWEAAYSLYEIAPDAKPAIGALKQALNDSSGHVRLNAVAALSKMDVPSAEMLPAVRKLLQDPDPEMRIDAANSMLSLDAPIAEVLPILLEGLKASNVKIRVKAAETLADYTLPVEVLPSLSQALKDPDAKVRENCAKAIGKVGLLAGSATASLAQALNDPESSVRNAAAKALASTGPSGKNGIPALVEAIRKDRDATVRQSAVRALAAIDVDDPAIVSGLIQGMKDPEKDVRAEAVDAFRDMQTVPDSAIAALDELSKTETDSTTKSHAENLLKDFKARSSIQTLQITPRPKIEALLQQLDKKLNDTDRNSFNDLPSAVQYLVARKIPYRKGEFWSAVTQGYAETVEAFLKVGMSPNTLTSGGADRATPLQSTTFTCSSPGAAQISLILLIYGADPNVVDSIGRTPILAAAESCPTVVVDALLMSGAKTDGVTKGGATVLAAAVMSGKVENVRSILKSGYKPKNEPPYLLQTAKANPEIHKMLLKAGIK